MSTASSTRTKVFILAGPTASGKTDLLLELFGSGVAGYASTCPRAVVVSADSMQVYRGMDIGTAKPGPELLARLPHRLIDILEPSQQYTAGDFVRLAESACADIAASGALPVLSGGTGFYLRSFLCGMPTAPAADAALRSEVARDLRECGAGALREELRSVDPESEGRIHPADLYRLTRAVEIVRATGRPLGAFASPESARDDFDFLVVGLERPREELYARIDARVDAMFEGGLAGEFLELRRSGFRESAPGMRAIGYREFYGLPAELFDLASELFERRPEVLALREAVKLDTRRYAKRQMTFFRALPGIRWAPPGAAALGELVSAFLAGEGPRTAGAR
ncbi:MAG TPA: tRNA (adenosine(37)-N6)-dimethylallyltransferase MiaA [Rectinemataceae bacterium]|nr:tRNA (adenosine(37)-N6)-dimethylallyltransferase MiaA [Rectinemataceae bacterium]